MIYTKERFKKLWDSDEYRITNDDCADCAIAWGIMSYPRTKPVNEVVYAVCKAAKVKDMPVKPIKL